MLNDLSAVQRLLAEYMSELSEQAHHAGWMQGLEYALWEAAIGQRNEYGQLRVTDHHQERLHQLSQAARAGSSMTTSRKRRGFHARTGKLALPSGAPARGCVCSGKPSRGDADKFYVSEGTPFVITPYRY
jgi:hypothetical protein